MMAVEPVVRNRKRNTDELDCSYCSECTADCAEPKGGEQQ